MSNDSNFVCSIIQYLVFEVLSNILFSYKAFPWVKHLKDLFLELSKHRYNLVKLS